MIPGAPWFDEYDAEAEVLATNEAVCPACRLVRNTATDGCGNCYEGEGSE